MYMLIHYEINKILIYSYVMFCLIHGVMGDGKGWLHSENNILS